MSKLTEVDEPPGSASTAVYLSYTWHSTASGSNRAAVHWHTLGHDPLPHASHAVNAVEPLGCHA